MSETLQLACGGNVQYMPHTAAMVRSVLDHAEPLSVHVHYMHDPDAPRRELERFRGFIEDAGAHATLIPVAAERIARLPGRGHLTPNMWYRTFLPELVPDADRVLYLDADVIALDALAPLWQTDLAGNHVAAVDNVWEPWNVNHPVNLGLSGSYFNSGVLLMNLERMRRDDSTSAIVEYALTHSQDVPWGDQDALNVVFSDSRLALHPRWNCMNSVLYFDNAFDFFDADQVQEARARPALRHFEGPSVNKPWHYLCEWQGIDEYFAARARTPWPRVRRTGVTPRNVARRAKRRLRRRVSA